MAKTESTAVNQLIANVQGRPLETPRQRDAGDDLFQTARRTTAPMPATMSRGRSATGTEAPLTQTLRAPAMPPIPAPAKPAGSAPTRTSTLPPPARNSAPNLRVPEAKGTPAPTITRPSQPDLSSLAAQPSAWVATPAGPAPTISSSDVGRPMAPPPPLHPHQPNATAPVEMINGADWFVESSQGVEQLEEIDIGTQSMKKQRKSPVGVLVGVGFILALGGVFVGGYLVFDGEGNKNGAAASGIVAPAPDPATIAAAAAADTDGDTTPAPAPAADPAAAAAPVADTVAAAAPAAAADTAAAPAAAPAAAAAPAVAAAPVPAPAPEPTAAPAAEPAPAPAAPAIAAAPVAPAPPAAAPASPQLVDVLFLSKPDGANVVLVDGGRTIPIGKTPVSASIDPSHSYEAVFALDGHKTRIAQLDPKRDRRFSVDMKSGKTAIKHAEASPAPAPVEVAAAPAPAPAPVEKAKPEKREPEKKRTAKLDDKKDTRKAGKKADKADKAADKPADKADKQSRPPTSATAS